MAPPTGGKADLAERGQAPTGSTPRSSGPGKVTPLKGRTYRGR